LIVKNREKFLFLRPLKPKELKDNIIYLGASFIKLAQVLATRADFFTDDYLDELRELHDYIPAMKQKEFIKVLVDKTIFKSFEESPIASASIGQVHIAYLHNNKKVAIKLKRFNIKKRVKADILILKTFSLIFLPLFSNQTKHSIESIIFEFSDMILQEVSFDNELANLEEFSRIYAKSGIIFPKPYREYCNDNMIVMSFEDGFRFDDKEALINKSINFEEIMSKLIYFYTEQMLINGYFHADPHPGNLLVNDSGNLVLLDFGMIKKIPNRTRVAIIELVKSANERDFELFIIACKKLGVIAKDADEITMQTFAQRMFDIFDNNNLDAKSMQKLAFSLLDSMKDLPFKLPQEAIYILRVSAIIEGLGTNFINNFNGIKDILPVLQKNIPKALGGDSFFEIFLKEIKSLPLTISKAKRVLDKVSEDEFIIKLSKDDTDIFRDYFKNILMFIWLLGIAIFLPIIDKEFFKYSIIIFTYLLFRIFKF
jgi:predicted unusual protein kinase regulating ubiquinone biosynthesis (AarF/ABC1/UbiB family)